MDGIIFPFVWYNYFVKYLFDSYLTAGIFSQDWKNGNIIPANKKENKNWIRDHRIVRLKGHFSLSYINDLLHDVYSVCKIFADNTSPFPNIKDFFLILTMGSMES